MKKIGWFTCVILIYLLSFSMFAANDKSVNFVTDQEKDGGFLLAITKEAFSRVGYKVNVEYMPWVRALNNVMEGSSEALLGAQYSEERAAKMQYTDVVGQSEMVFFKMKDTKINYSKLEDLKPYVIGTITTSVYTPEFDAASYLKKESVTDYLQNIQKLISGRIQLFLEKKYVVLNTVKTRYPDYYGKINYLQPPLKELKFYNCFSKKIPGYKQKVADFNRGLSMIIKDGTFKKIMDQELHE